MTDQGSSARPTRPPTEETVVLQAWAGPWEPDDPDANYKSEIALYANQDPMETLRGLSEAIDVPVGAIARYVLARYATSGSGGLLELGPSMVHRLWGPIEAAEADGSDEARLGAYHELRQILSWLRLPLIEDAGYPPQQSQAEDLDDG